MKEHDSRCQRWHDSHIKYGGTMTWREIAEADGLTRDVVKNRVARWMEDEPPPTEQKGDMVFEDKKPLPSDGDIQALLDAYLNVQEKAKALSMKQEEATVRFDANVPILLVFFGDPHIGAWGWAARRQLEDLKLVTENEGVYPVFMGDEWDNFIFNFGKWASMMPPEHQRAIAHYLFKQIIPRTVAVVGGNHLHWTSKAAGIDLNAELAEKMRAVFLGHRGDLHLKVNTQKYDLFLHHRSKGASTTNKSNSARITSDEIGGADVIVEADRHDPWKHEEYKARRKQVWLRTGTYKVNDDYTAEIDFEQGKWDMPAVVFYPDQHKTVPFMNFRDGIIHLKALRKESAN